MSILQSPQWARFRSMTPGVKKALKIGSTFVYIHRIPGLPLTVGYLPRPETLNNLEEIKKACLAEKAIFLKVEPAKEFKIQNSKFKIGQPVLPRHTIYVDLTKSEEALLSAMHEKTRYNIRLAAKKGVRVKEWEDKNDLEGFIELLEKTESRQGFYSHNRDYYRKLWEALRPAKMVYLLSAYSGTELAASIMLFKYGEMLYYPYGGSDPKYREVMAPHLLHWEAIKLGKRLGCKTYDMWGSYKDRPVESDPWWGIYRFKSGFGGEKITFPETIDVPLSPLYYFYPLADKFRFLLKK